MFAKSKHWSTILGMNSFAASCEFGKKKRYEIYCVVNYKGNKEKINKHKRFRF